MAAGTARADPANAKGHLPIALDCGGVTVTTVSNGNGPWTPAHDVNGTSVFVPTLFGAQEGAFTDPEGNESPFSDPGLFPKGSASPRRGEIVDCTFVVDAEFPDGSSIFVTGEVSGFFTH